MTHKTLLDKYNIPVPRYTSYPTVPHWDSSTFSVGQWETQVKNTFSANKEISVYIHLPFCSQLCTYCGCHKRITKNHSYELPYIEAVLKEWRMYVDLLGEKPVVRELHLGGGTPTFFSPDNLSKLIHGILQYAIVPEQPAFSFEAHPANTTVEHLEALYKVGFRRMSLGVQDFGEDIMTLINRTQDPRQIIDLTIAARNMGYTSINYDLIYGLPRQTASHIEATMDYVSMLQPDRIAFYSYAHVPWKSPSQRAYSEVDLPMGQAKQDLFDLGKKRLEQFGYKTIGMDHFTLPGDELYVAQTQGQLHRNFMGYTPHKNPLMIGLGASSISDSWTAFSQNEKNIERYQELVNDGELPLFRGHLLSQEDLLIRRHILNLMCNYRTDWFDTNMDGTCLRAGLERLADMQAEGLVNIWGNMMKVTPAGRPFIRNICMALDSWYWKKKEGQKGKVFSQAV